MASSGKSDDGICPICREQFNASSKSIIVCKHQRPETDPPLGGGGVQHLFHRECIAKQFRRTPSDNCAICRAPCEGLRDALVAAAIRRHDYGDAADMLVGGAYPPTPGVRTRARAMLYTAFGIGSDGDGADFALVVELLRRAVTHDTASQFMLFSIFYLGVDPDAHRPDDNHHRTPGSAGYTGGRITVLGWLLRMPRPGFRSTRLRAVRLLLRLGVNALEALEEATAFLPIDDPTIDLVMQVHVSAEELYPGLGQLQNLEDTWEQVEIVARGPRMERVVAPSTSRVPT